MKLEFREVNAGGKNLDAFKILRYLKLLKYIRSPRKKQVVGHSLEELQYLSIGLKRVNLQNRLSS